MAYIRQNISMFGPHTSNPVLANVSRCHTEQGNTGFGQVGLGGISPGTTLINEIWGNEKRDPTKANPPEQIHLLQLGLFPLKASDMKTYAEVRSCEIRCYDLDVTKIFAFLSELPSLEKVIIGHSAICNGIQSLTAEEPARFILRKCSPVKKLVLKLEDSPIFNFDGNHAGDAGGQVIGARNQAEAERNRRFVTIRVANMLEMAMAIAVDIKLLDVEVPTWMDLAGCINPFLCDVKIQKVRPRLQVLAAGSSTRNLDEPNLVPVAPTLASARPDPGPQDPRRVPARSENIRNGDNAVAYSERGRGSNTREEGTPYPRRNSNGSVSHGNSHSHRGRRGRRF